EGDADVAGNALVAIAVAVGVVQKIRRIDDRIEAFALLRRGLHRVAHRVVAASHAGVRVPCPITAVARARIPGESLRAAAVEPRAPAADRTAPIEPRRGPPHYFEALDLVEWNRFERRRAGGRRCDAHAVAQPQRLPAVRAAQENPRSRPGTAVLHDLDA